MASIQNTLDTRNCVFPTSNKKRKGKSILTYSPNQTGVQCEVLPEVRDVLKYLSLT